MAKLKQSERLDNLENKLDQLLTMMVEKEKPIKKEIKKIKKKTPKKNPIKKSTTKKLVKTKEKIVSINVNPQCNINGRKFLGQCKVPESLAGVLRAMMGGAQQEKAKASLFMNHGIQNLGEV